MDTIALILQRVWSLRGGGGETVIPFARHLNLFRLVGMIHGQKATE